MDCLGYADPEYGECFKDIAAPIYLPSSSANLLSRPVPNSHFTDAIAAYPILCCSNWSKLLSDLEAIDGSLVSIVAVIDPLIDWSPDSLARCFPDMCRVYKEHYLVNLSQDPERFIHPHHWRNIAKSLKSVDVIEQPGACVNIDQWCAMYDNLIARHAISGIACFSRAYFERMAHLKGMIVFTALKEQKPVGMMWCLRNERDVYYHLAAYHDVGYEAGASYALFWTAINTFKRMKLRYLALGAGAGVQAASQGLSRFKAGWSTESRPAYLCGRISDRVSYHQLCHRSRCGTSDFFPAYRASDLNVG